MLFAETCARGFGYLLAEAGVTINGQSGGILPVLVFGAGTDYALLLVSRYREELRRHDSKHEAMQLALRTAGPAILFCGLTVMAALLVLVLAEVNGTAGLGPIGAMGIFLAMTLHGHDAARAARRLRPPRLLAVRAGRAGRAAAAAHERLAAADLLARGRSASSRAQPRAAAAPRPGSASWPARCSTSSCSRRSSTSST